MLQNILSFRPKPADWIFSVKTFAASMLALYIAMAFDLDRPVWSMATVYIVAHPLSGVLASKAVYRVLGTLLGAVVAVILIPNLVNAPVVLSAVLALWVGVCLFFARLDRTPRSYVLMLAGYTVALIGFPSVTDPMSIFPTAIARFQEITLGILCAALVGHIILPRHLGPVIAAQIDGWMGDVAKLVTESFDADMDPDQLDRDRARIASDLGELRGMALHLGYEKSRFAGQTRELQALQSAMAALLPVCFAVHDRLTALKAADVRVPEELRRLCDDIIKHVNQENHDPALVADLHHRVTAFRDQIRQADDWGGLLMINLCDRLHRLLDFHHDCRVLWDGIRAGKAPSDLLGRWYGAAGAEGMDRDANGAVRSGIAAMVAVIAVCAFWIATGWNAGGTAAMMAAVGSSIMSFLDNPVPALKGFMRYTTIAVGGVVFYNLMILPGIDGFPLLVLSFAPYCIVLGVFMTSQVTYGFGLAMVVNLVMILNLDTTFSSDIESILGGGVASLIGFAAAVVATALIRVVPADQSIMRLVRANWRDIAAVARGSFAHGRLILVRRLLDRQGLILPRLAMAPQRRDTLIRVMPEVSIASALYDLRMTTLFANKPVSDRIKVLLRSIARHFEARLTDPDRLPDPWIVEEVDNLLRMAVSDLAAAERERLVLPLVALRRTLSKTGAPRLRKHSGGGMLPAQPTIMGETA
ncbi:FUSC family protein [Thalassospira sp. ER-Se-21-Dark]|uniref:FUSC family protein n=1 Tax=Thalassospira sp. ER-Se-21-Dark TaxID=2585190 RepID=UPI001B31223C|nr:FUSC family protein [Thalassospira sp. ER-Se-21-Dark]MBP3125189.1 FUSC family protein [Thalassospira sp. ER-Se-21-Dark]